MALHRNKTKSSRQRRVGKPVVFRPDESFPPAKLLQLDWFGQISVVTIPYMPDFSLLQNLMRLAWVGLARMDRGWPGGGSCWDWETALLLPGAPPSPVSIILLTLGILSFARVSNSGYPPQREDRATLALCGLQSFPQLDTVLSVYS